MLALVCGQFSQCIKEIDASVYWPIKYGPRAFTAVFADVCRNHPECVQEFDPAHGVRLGYGVFVANEDGTVKELASNYDSSD